MHGFCVWFDVTFDPHHTYKSKSAAAQDTGGQVVVLSTAPGEKPTHWKQTFILLPADRGFPVNPDTSTPPPFASCRWLLVVSANEVTCVQCSDNGQHGDDHC